MLNLHEELFMLAIHDEKGTVVGLAENGLRFGLAGALLAELALSGKLTVDKNHRLELLEREPGINPLLNETMEKLARTQETQKVGAAVKSLSKGSSELRERVAQSLVQAEVFMQEDTRLIWITPYGDMPGTGSAKYWLKQDLRAAVLAGAETDLRRLALLNLAMGAGLLGLIFTKDERKMAEHRIYEMTMAEGLSNPQTQAIQEIASAVEAHIAD